MSEVRVKKLTIKHKDNKPRRTITLRRISANKAVNKLSRASRKNGAW